MSSSPSDTSATEHQQQVSHPPHMDTDYPIPNGSPERDVLIIHNNSSTSKNEARPRQFFENARDFALEGAKFTSVEGNMNLFQTVHFHGCPPPNSNITPQSQPQIIGGGHVRGRSGINAFDHPPHPDHQGRVASDIPIPSPSVPATEKYYRQQVEEIGTFVPPQQSLPRNQGPYQGMETLNKSGGNAVLPSKEEIANTIKPKRNGKKASRWGALKHVKNLFLSPFQNASKRKKKLSCWSYLTFLLLQRCCDPVLGSPLVRPQQDMEVGDIGLFDRTGNFRVLYNLRIPGRGEIAGFSPPPGSIKFIENTSKTCMSTTYSHHLLLKAHLPPLEFHVHFSKDEERSLFKADGTSYMAQELLPTQELRDWITSKNHSLFQETKHHLGRQAAKGFHRLVFITSTSSFPSFMHFSSLPASCGNVINPSIYRTETVNYTFTVPVDDYHSSNWKDDYGYHKIIRHTKPGSYLTTHIKVMSIDEEDGMISDVDWVDHKTKFVPI